MSIVARHVASTSARTAVETWAKVTELFVLAVGSAVRKDVDRAVGVACAAIASEVTKDAPIVIWGVGPRVRVYCIFDEDAVTGDGVHEDALTSCPTDGDWKMSIPCAPE